MVPIENGRYLAEHIDGVRLLSFPGPTMGSGLREPTA